VCNSGKTKNAAKSDSIAWIAYEIVANRTDRATMCPIEFRPATHALKESLAMLIRANSLSATVDAVNEAIASGQKISASDRKAVARWIASRQGLPGAYAGTFAGFEPERKQGIQLFTGERITSASARHILGEEACRALYQLKVRDRDVQQALTRATDGLMERLAWAELHPRHINIGLFCCGKCSVGLWRHLLVGGLDRQEERLKKGIGYLHSMRDGKGGWRAFPFWYTVLALSETEGPEASAEIRYTAATLERAAKRSSSTRFGQRRQRIAERALAKT
jgi:hypothetical protein